MAKFSLTESVPGSGSFNVDGAPRQGAEAFSVDVATFPRGSLAFAMTQDADGKIRTWREGAKVQFTGTVWTCPRNEGALLHSVYPAEVQPPKYPWLCIVYLRDGRDPAGETDRADKWQARAVALKSEHKILKEHLGQYNAAHQDLAHAVGYDEPGQNLPGMSKLVGEVERMRESMAEQVKGMQAITGFIRDSEWTDLLTTDPVLADLEGEVRRLCREQAQLVRESAAKGRTIKELAQNIESYRGKVAELQRASKANRDACLEWERLAEEFTGTDSIKGARAELEVIRKEQGYWRKQYNGAMQQVRDVERDSEKMEARALTAEAGLEVYRRSYDELLNARAIVAAAQPMTMTVTIGRAVDMGLVPASSMSLPEILDYLTCDVDMDSYSQRNAETFIRRITWLRDRMETGADGKA